MFYSTKKDGWTLEDFVKKQKLPCLAVVNQGYYGDKPYNVLDTGQVLRVQGVYTEHRVLARLLKDTGMSFRRGALTVSIPMTCDVPMFEMKKGKTGNSSKLLQWLVSNERTFPFDVQLDTSTNSMCMIRAGNERHAVSGTVQLRIYDRHVLRFIFGNPVSKDTVYGNIFSILIDDCYATLSSVSGLTNGDDGYYNHIVEHMRVAVDTYVNFKGKVGHRDMFIASLVKHEESSKNLIGQDSSAEDLEIYVKPDPVILDNHVYEEIKVKTRESRIDPHLLYEEITLTNGAHISKDVLEVNKYLKHKGGIKVGKKSPAIKCHRRSTLHPGSLPGRTNTTDVENKKYSKPLPPTPNENNPTTLATTNETVQTRWSLSSTDVSRLTIEELSKYLGLLNLSKHTEKFTAEQVDGCLLQELDEQLLQDEFGLSRFEAIKLTKFARSGYLPLSSKDNKN